MVMVTVSIIFNEVNVSTSNGVLSVKDLNQMVKDLLADAIGQIWLVGEISNFSKPASGHWYFTLKDDSAQVRCAMFRNSNFKTGFILQNGQQVLVSASVTLYEARGEYQLVVEKMQLAGAGLLQQKFDQLKQKLQQEGLFDYHYKKALPKNILRVGIVTSATGAALHDICQILKRRDPSLHIIIYPSLVQGQEAAQQIAKMITLANKRNECDVLIVGRGGGSLEDLWPFNEEVVARAIFNSTLPIISAVGHEVDFTIADFVADLRAATPSAAAELVSRNQQEKYKNLQALSQKIAMSIDYFLLRKSERLQKLRHLLHAQHPQVKLAKQQTRLVNLNRALSIIIQQYIAQKTSRMNQLYNTLQRQTPEHKIHNYQYVIQQKQALIRALAKRYITQSQHQMAVLATRLHSISPLATLERGYSITTVSKQQVLRSLNQVNIGDVLETQLSSGKITSTIIQIEENPNG